MIELGEAIISTQDLPRVITNNEGGGFFGQAYTKHKNENKAHRSYNSMHSKVKKTAIQHLRDAKKPNVMVRDYLDSKYGRHLHDMHVDGKSDDAYINRSFKDFKKEYKPELFKEETTPKRNLVNVHVNWTGDYGSKDHFHKQFPSMKHAKKYTSDFEKKERYSPVWRYEPTNRIRESNNEVPVNEEYLSESDHAGTWEIQGRDGRYKKIHIKAHPKFGYQIHMGSNRVLNATKKQVKGFIQRNSAVPVNESYISEESIGHKDVKSIAKKFGYKHSWSSEEMNTDTYEHPKTGHMITHSNDFGNVAHYHPNKKGYKEINTSNDLQKHLENTHKQLKEAYEF